MKPTKEQIEAALRYADDMETAEDNDVIDATPIKPCFNQLADRFTATSLILAAAYREKCAELEKVQAKLSVANLIRAIDNGEKINSDF